MGSVTLDKSCRLHMEASDGFCYIGQESCKLHMEASDGFCYIGQEL